MLTNRKRFDQLEYFNNPIVKESVINYLEFPKTNQKVLYKVSQAEVELEDSLLVTLEDLNERKREFFEVKKEDIFTRTPYWSRLSIIFSFDLDKGRIER